MQPLKVDVAAESAAMNDAKIAAHYGTSGLALAGIGWLIMLAGWLLRVMTGSSLIEEAAAFMGGAVIVLGVGEMLCRMATSRPTPAATAEQQP